MVPKSSGPLLAGLPLKFPPQWNFGLNGSLRGFRFSSGVFGNVHRKFPYHLSPFLNLNSRSVVATSCFGSLSTLLYTSDGTDVRNFIRLNAHVTSE